MLNIVSLFLYLAAQLIIHSFRLVVIKKSNDEERFWETIVNGTAIKLYTFNTDNSLKQFRALCQVISAFMWIRFRTILKHGVD